LLQLDASTASQQVRDTGRLSLASSDLSFDLELVPHDLRAPDYRAEEFGADGVGHATNIGPVHTFKGSARRLQSGMQLPQVGEARFTIDEKGIDGLIVTPTERYFVEPARRFSKAATTSEYVIYRESDVVTSLNAECGVTLSEEVNRRIEAISRPTAPGLSPFSNRPNNSTTQKSLLSSTSLATPQLTPGTAVPFPSPAPNCTEELLTSGQPLDRTLDPKCTFPGGQFTARYTFFGVAGERVEIAMTSTEFDTYLYLYNEPTSYLAQDDNGAGGTDSRIPAGSGSFILPATGNYYILASSALPNQTGSYRIAFNSTVSPPANDNFANAQRISGTAGSLSSNNVGATKEPGEPNHGQNSGGTSVWFVWQAPSSGFVIFTTTGSSFDTLMGGYTGLNVSSLTEHDADDDDPGGGLQSKVNFNVNAGTDYYIAVDGYNGATGSIVLNWNLAATAPTPSVSPSPTPNPSPLPLQDLRLATEADHDYVLARGGPAEADRAVLSIINQVEGIYELELGLSIKIVYQSTWDTANDPYSTSNPSALLGELTDYWNANRGSVARDMVHMWTGKHLDNGTIGTAYLEALCHFSGNGRAAYGISASISGPQQIAITAHEIGHNLGATHPNQQVPPISDCDNTLMSSSVGATPQLSFCQYSRDEINAYLNSRVGCLENGISQLSFFAATNYAVGEDPISVTSSDFNGDGKEDLAVANFRSDSVSVLLGSDGGIFQPAVNYATGHGPSSIVVGDFNHDRKEDLVVTNESENSVSVLLGTGSGDFQPQGSFSTEGTPESPVVGDFNGDGNSDLLVVTNFNSDLFDASHLTVLFGNGMGQFQPAIHVYSGEKINRVAVGDFSGDQILDLVVLTSFHGVNVLLGNGTGGFQPLMNYATQSRNLEAVAVGDVNEDGKQDFIIGDSKNVSVFLNTGAGSFQTPLNQSVESFPISIALSDFNNDGLLDLAVLRFDNGIVTLLGDGTGAFKHTANYFIKLFPSSFAVGDFNGDGNQDVSVADGSIVSVLLGLGTGALEAAPNYVIGTLPFEVAVGDFNNDGNADVATAISDDNNVGVMLGDGSGALQSAAHYPTDLNPTSLVLADFNGDGASDIAVANDSSNSVGVLLGLGPGAFQPMAKYDVFTPYRLASDDLNGDGNQDLVATVRSLNGVFVGVLLGTGDGGFQPTVYYFVGSSPTSHKGAVAITDVNGDAKKDLVVASEDRDDVSVLLGTGNGSFLAPVTYAVGNSPTSIVAGDFNHDGKADVAVTNYDSGNVSVLLGTGNGGFQPATNYPAGSSPYYLSIGDFNNDGNQDLVVANFNPARVNASSLVILLGDGGGVFRPIATYLVGTSPSSAAVADFNNDNKQDVVVTHDDGNLGSLILLVNTSRRSAVGPPNDNFAAARVIRGPTGTIAGSTVLATVEPGEPDNVSGNDDEIGASIWYRWTAPATGKFYFQTFSSSFPTVLAVYTGNSVGALTNVVRSTGAAPEYVEFNATAGTTYQIAIDGLSGDTGRTVLTWNMGSLTNDDFAFAREIRGSSGSVNGDNSNFTLQINEPTLSGPGDTGFSAWYRWTAPNTGKVSFATAPCGDTTRLLGAYTGNFIDTLNPVAVNFDGYRDFDDPGVCDNRSLRFNAVAGTTYRIQLRSLAGKPFTLSWSYANPPPNDNFANALILAGASGSVVGTNRDATKEPGEPDHAGGPGGASIWYRWTAPNSGPITFDAIGFRNQTSNSFRYLTALIAVYIGSSLSTLNPVVANATDNRVTFKATAGTTYQIAIDSGPYTGGGYLPGLVPLHWGAKQVANDDFANAQPLTVSGSFVPLLGSNAGATKETGEPNHGSSAGGTSVWYRWTALSTGNVSFRLQPCTTCTLAIGNALVGVYTGANVNALTALPTSVDNNHTFTAVRGTTYFIAVDSNTSAGGSYEFSLVSANISARNDAFANAQVLSGSAGAAAGDNSGASKEIAEPNHANDIGGASVWYQWKAPASGLFTFDTFGSNFDTLLGVYTGNVVSALSVVASSANAGSSAQSRVTFDAKLNTTYFIAVDGKSNGVEQGTGLPRSQAGFILLNWNNLPPPVNDNFANAQAINGVFGNVTGRNTVASKEGGEPNHAGSPGGASVWYQWTAPSSGNFSFNTFGSDFNTLLAVYTGNSLTTLTAVSGNDDVGGVAQSHVTFNATGGTVYYIAVDGSVGVPGNITPFTGSVALSWALETGVSNDNLLLAQQLNGASGSLTATNAGTSKETGEPNHAADRGGRSVWYSWTAPSSGPVLFTTAGSDFDTLLAVYIGTRVNQLTTVTTNDDSPYADNLAHILTSSVTFTAAAGTTYKIAVDGSGGRFGNFALRWGPDAQISGKISFLSGVCGSDKKVTMLLSGEDTRAVTFTGSGTYTFEHLRVGGNYSVRGISEISASCLPLFLERAQNSFPLAGAVLDANFFDDGLRGGGSTSNITGHVQNAGGVGLHNVAIALSGDASRTVYTDNTGLYLLPNLPAGTYYVTPSKAGAVFSPPEKKYVFTSGQTITDADFATQDSFNISGQTRDQNGASLSGASITLNDGRQGVSVQTDSNGYYAFDATAGGSYSLTATKAGLSFTPSLQSIATLNANQKNIDFTVTQTQTQTLMVTSVNPNSGVNITVTPADKNNLADGTTQFTRTYELNTTINLTAPATAGANVFQKWLKDGADYSTSLTTSVLLDADHTMTAVYLTTVAQTPAGQNVSVELNGVKVTFATVTGPGTTTITPINPATAGQLPNGYQLTGDSIGFDITSSAIVQPPIAVCFNVPFITDAAVFAQLRLLHNENGGLVDRTSTQNFTVRQICANVSSLSPFVLASSSFPLLQLLLEESTSTQAAALDAVLLLRDPFPVMSLNPLYAGTDRNTRVLVFVKNLQLQPGETAAVVTVNVVDSSGHSYDVGAEGVWAMPSLDFSQVTFRLPDNLSPGSCKLQIKAHGQVSNVGLIQIRP
jgi:Metallo-peptidase family M12/FG-GAP-like repeat/Carboxypeptidase regulatory-like domain